MNTTRKNVFFKAIVLAIAVAGCLVSCKQTTNDGSTISEMQTRLDDIMREYEEMQSTCDEYTAQLAAKDSSIRAQQAEIQQLINQLNQAKTGNGKTKASKKSSKADEGHKCKMSEVVAAKTAEIAELQARLDKQTEELNALKNASNYSDIETLARLQLLVKDQDARIVALTNDKVALTCINDSLAAHVAYLLGQRNNTVISSSEDYAAQVSMLQGQVSAQQDEINRLREELSRQTALVAEANEAAKTAKAEADKAVADSHASAAQTKGSINKKLAQLQAQCDEYYEELERLRAENIMLRSENDSLRSEMVVMRRNAENVAVENAKMAAKMSRASVLSTGELNVTPLKRMSNGTGKPTNRASATQAFRIEGMILGNNVVEPGTITIYAVITSPSNIILHNGTMEQKFDANGVRTTYTMVQAYEFTGATRAFDMSWSCDDDMELESGIYRLSLYAGGNQIGMTEFKLK